MSRDGTGLRRCRWMICVVAALGGCLVPESDFRASAPIETMLTGTPGQISGENAEFSFSANRATATFECGLDGAPPIACSSPLVVTALGQGAHTFAVRALVAATGEVDA